MFRPAYDAGFASVWDNANDEPVNPRPERDFGKAHANKVPTRYDFGTEYQAEWLEGYDDGVKSADAYGIGLAAGLAGNIDLEAPDKDYRHEFTSGWYKGYSAFVRGKLKPILKAAGKLGLVVNEVSYPDYDDIEGVEYAGRSTYKRLSRKDLLDTVVSYLAGDRYGRDEPIPTDVEGIKRAFLNSNESDYGHTRLLTVKEMKKEKDKAEYDRMERAAQHFAGKCGKKMGTMEFLRALDRAVNEVRYQRERWNDGETRMEEWAACMYSGAGRETYFDDLNYVNGKYEAQADDLQDVYSYIERKFPLLFMKYQEWKARRQQRKKK